MTEYSPEAWESFFVANAGAAAALAGLVFVGVSINVEEIVASRRLTGRALEAFTLLTGVLLISALGLVPDIGTTGYGIALMVVGAEVELVVTWQHVHAWRRYGGEDATAAPPGSNAIRMLIGQGAALSTIVAGATLLVEGGGGVYWLVGSVLLGYVGALVNTWVLLIEIRR